MSERQIQSVVIFRPIWQLAEPTTKHDQCLVVDISLIKVFLKSFLIEKPTPIVDIDSQGMNKTLQLTGNK